MKVSINMIVKVHDLAKLRDYVYNVLNADQSDHEVDDILGGDRQVAMVGEALIANGDVAPLDMGVEIISRDAYAMESHWDVNADHPLKDWQYEVSNDDTRLGYHQWVADKKEQEADEQS